MNYIICRWNSAYYTRYKKSTIVSCFFFKLLVFTFHDEIVEVSLYSDWFFDWNDIPFGGNPNSGCPTVQVNFSERSYRGSTKFCVIMGY